MTAAPQLYVRDGSRFVPVDDAPPARPLPPIPTPVPVPDVVDAEPTADGRSSFVPVPAPRCPHGHFARWAARNCCAKESR